MTNLEMGALGFAAVVIDGLILTYTAYRIRRRLRIWKQAPVRHAAWNRVHVASVAARAAQPVAEPHVCSFPQPCGVVLWERDRQAAQDRLR